MESKNKELMESLLQDTLEAVKESEINSQEEKENLNNARELIKAINETDKVEIEDKQRKQNFVIDVAKVVVMPVAVLGLTYLSDKDKFAREVAAKKEWLLNILDFEKTGTLLSSAGKHVSDWLRWK